jgi:hypothetical protein
LNRCTHYRGKLDQHVTRIRCSVYVWSHTIHISRGQHIATFHEVINRFIQIHYPKKKGSRHNLQLDICLIHGSVPSFSPTTANEAMGKRQTFVDNQLLALLDPYHWHAIDTFNTCSWGLNYRSLTDTGVGYILEGTNFPHTTPRLFQPTVSPFHLRAPPDLQFIQNLSTKPVFKFKGTYGRHVVFRPLGQLP